jgi:nitronate monooxygenase
VTALNSLPGTLIEPAVRTSITERLRLTHPIVQAPMAGGWTTPALVAAVAETGSLGMLAWARLTTDQMREQAEELRRRTGRPVGVNFLVPTVPPEDAAGSLDHPLIGEIRRRLGLPESAEPPAPFGSVEQGIEIALESRVPIVSFAMGSPAAYVGRLHAAGVFVIASVTTVAEALEVEAAGVDAIVAQGAEGGGHRSTFTARNPDQTPLIGTMALVPQVVDAVRVPVIAAGGIMDARGIAAALALGAQAAQLGTRFLLAEEAGTTPGYRQRLIEALETDTVVTDVFTGRVARALRNALVDEFERAGARPLPWPRQGMAASDIYSASIAGDGDWAPLMAGQGLRLARRVQPAKEIVAELAADLERIRSALVP